MKLRLGAALLIPAIALTLAACGSDKSDSTGTPQTANGMQAYLDCLRQQGITLPSNFGQRGNFPSGRPTAFPSDRPTDRPTAFPSGEPGRGGFNGGGFFGRNAPSGVDQAKWEAAQQSCASVRPTFGPGGQRPGGGFNAAYRNCLSDHGVTLGQGQRLSTADPKVADAMKVCEALRPSSAPSN